MHDAPVYMLISVTTKVGGLTYSMCVNGPVQAIRRTGCSEGATALRGEERS